MNNKFKNQLAEMIIEMNETTEDFNKRDLIEQEARGVKQIHDQTRAFSEGFREDSDEIPETDFVSKILKETRTEFKRLSTLSKQLPSEDQLVELMFSKEKEYLEMVAETNKETPFYDVFVEMGSKYPGGTETLKSVISEMKNNGNNIEIVHEEFSGRDNKLHGGGIDTDFVIVMPSSSYAEFNKKIIKDQPNSSNDVITVGKKDFFFMNHLNKETSLEKIKSLIKVQKDAEKLLSKNGESFDGTMEVTDIFRSEIGIGVSKITDSNYNNDSKASNAIRFYFEGINKLSKEKFVSESIYPSATGRKVDGSSRMKQLNPYDEAVIFKATPEVKLEEKVEKKKRKTSRPGRTR